MKNIPTRLVVKYAIEAFAKSADTAITHVSNHIGYGGDLHNRICKGQGVSVKTYDKVMNYVCEALEKTPEQLREEAYQAFQQNTSLAPSRKASASAPNDEIMKKHRAK